MTADYVSSLRDALLAIVHDGADLPDVLSGALGRAAIELGSVDALTGERMSREAAHVRLLAGWAFLPPRALAAEDRRRFRQLLKDSSFGCPNRPRCGRMLVDHDHDGWDDNGAAINPRCPTDSL